MCQNPYLSWAWIFIISDANFTLKTGLKWKNKDTFTNETFWGQGMKVPLFLGFGDILMLKIKSQKRQLWGFGDQRGMTQITWDQVRGGHFGPIYPLFDYFWNLKKLTHPNCHCLYCVSTIEIDIDIDEQFAKLLVLQIWYFQYYCSCLSEAVNIVRLDKPLENLMFISWAYGYFLNYRVFHIIQFSKNPAAFCASKFPDKKTINLRD